MTRSDRSRPLHAPRGRALALLAVGVLAAHALLLAGLHDGPDTAPRGVSGSVMQVRQIGLAEVPSNAGLAAVAAARALPAAPRSTPAPGARPPRSSAATPTRAAVADQGSADAAVVIARRSAADADASVATPNADPAGAAVPVYATRLPPGATLQFALQRGSTAGSAVLDWAPQPGGSYTLTLQRDLPGAPRLAWASQGTVDANGIAPDRHTASRRGRELRAVNFQRDSARITYSGPQREHALLPGAQDRLSWMLQLAAVVAADATLAEPGSRVLLVVAGTRGDADVWTFTMLGTEPTDNGANALLHFSRAAERPYDTQADVWLDPARHHLPVRALLTPRGGGDATELRLQTLTLRTP